MEHKRIRYLVEQYLQGSLTAEEDKAFEHLMGNAAYHEELKDAFDELLEQARPGGKPDETLLPLLDQILRGDHIAADGMPADTHGQAKRVWNTVWFRSAAAVLVLAIGLAIWQRSADTVDADENPLEAASTILPGGNKAILTLSDGRTMSLAGLAKDTVVTLGGTAILNEGNEGLVYKKVSSDQVDVLNTIATPNGGQYRVVLSDGTRVWLNAASSITFPLHFADDKRVVKLTGEAYFEVNTVTNDGGAAGQKTPFIVSVNDMEVKVLGTRFNINSFEEENGVRTTLLEGAVQVARENISQAIYPGQQVVYNRQSGQFDVSDVADGYAVAWKDGRFDFNGTLKDIMGQISRWYDIDVDFEMTGGGADKWFVGSVSRSETLDKVLTLIQLTGEVNFKVEKNKVVVMD